MLPGTNRAADRFARASFYVDAIPQTLDRRTATASVFGVIRNVSVPYGISTPDEPNISSTRWRTVADHRDRRYYFESALSPNVFWVDLDGVDFAADSGVRSLPLGENQANVFAGDVADELVETEPFDFLGVPAPSGRSSWFRHRLPTGTSAVTDRQIHGYLALGGADVFAGTDVTSHQGDLPATRISREPPVSPRATDQSS